MTSELLRTKPKELTKTPKLCELLGLVGHDLCQAQYEDAAFWALFTDEEAKLWKERNEWATKVLDKLLKETIRSGLYHRSVSEGLKERWLMGHLPLERRPQKLALILDEATDLDLASGLVACVGEITRNYRSELAGKDALLVLTGTGLDLLRSDGRIGTDPRKAKVVTMMRPKMKELLNATEGIDEVVQHAIMKGMYSRIFRTNARMLFRGVYTVLLDEFLMMDALEFNDHDRDERRRARLVEVASFRALMDYCPRFYVSTGVLGCLDSRDQSRLLERAFLFHLKSALEPEENDSFAAAVQSNRDKMIIDVDNWISANGTPVQEIFELGLATKRHETSSALKYLSCFGLTCEPRPGFEDSLEELTALHCLRLAEIQGYSTERHFLQCMWPFASDAQDDSTDEEYMQEWKETLRAQKEQEKLVLPSSEKFCVVFSQKTPSVQGLGVIVLYADEEGAVVDFIQCRNEKESPGPSRVQKWWNSLGIDLREDKNHCFTPQHGPSGYSYTGMQEFCTMIEETLTMTKKKKKDSAFVQIRQRVLAVAFPCPPKSTDFPIPKDESVRVWFREMLEPTVSVLSPTEVDP